MSIEGSLARLRAEMENQILLIAQYRSLSDYKLIEVLTELAHIPNLRNAYLYRMELPLSKSFLERLLREKISE